MHTSLAQDLTRLAELASPFQPGSFDERLATMDRYADGRPGFVLTEDGKRVARRLRQELLEVEDALHHRDWDDDEWIPLHAVVASAGALDGALNVREDAALFDGDVCAGVAVVLGSMAAHAANKD